MAGIEVAGLVLAALPFVADGIDKYVAAAHRTEKLFQPARELRKVRTLLTIESEIFRNTCELLLTNITNEIETEALLSGPGGKEWASPELEAKLRQVLETSYTAARSVLTEIHEAIVELRSHLHLDPNGNVSKAADFSAFRNLWFSIGRQKQDALLEQIKAGNNSFKRIVRQSLDLEPIRASKRRRARNFVSARRETTALFALLDQSLQCQCTPQHALYLCLESTTPKTGFEVCQFVLLTDSVRLAAFETIAGMSFSAQQIAAQQLCHTLFNHAAAEFPKRVGFLEEANSKRRSVVVNAVCLGAVDSFDRSQMEFHGRDRRRLALIMAVSVLKLYSTPWVEEQWVREYVSFARKHGSLRLATPLIEKRLMRAPAPQSALSASQSIMLMSIRSEALFALGIFLIELCFKKPLASLQLPGDKIEGGLLECLTEFRTATRLIPEVYDEAGQRYGDAVRRCIRCDFDQKTYDIDSEDFCQAVYEGVVSPLEEDVDVIDGPEALAECASGFRLKRAHKSAKR